MTCILKERDDFLSAFIGVYPRLSEEARWPQMNPGEMMRLHRASAGEHG